MNLSISLVPSGYRIVAFVEAAVAHFDFGGFEFFRVLFVIVGLGAVAADAGFGILALFVGN